MDHSGHGDSHAMVFHAGVNQEILFAGWVTTNALELFGSAIAIFVAGILYEGFKYTRELMLMNSSVNNRDSQVNITSSGLASDTKPTFQKQSMFSIGHFTQTLMHTIQTTISYILMLIFMTYNVWLCIALVLGLAVGYFLFGWNKKTVIDSTEHCQ